MGLQDSDAPANSRFLLKAALLVVVLAGIVAGSAYLQPTIARAGAIVREQGPFGALAYVGFMALAVVVLPLSSLPLLPVAAEAWGVLLGGTLSVIGWWVGSLAAFLIARRLGRPVIARIVRLSRLDKWETTLPQHATFFSIVLIRLVFPVEIPSYILGLTKSVRFPSYALASLLGMTPFAYVMLAMGGAVATGSWLTFAAIGVLAATLVYGLYLLWQRHYRPEHG